MTMWKTILRGVKRATGIGYKSLDPLYKEPECRKQLLAANRMRSNTLSITKEMDKLERILSNDRAANND